MAFRSLAAKNFNTIHCYFVRRVMINLLFQHNRWLAEMEERVDAGIVHTLRNQDHGLVVVLKDDKYAEEIRQKHDRGDIRFSYLLRTPDTLSPESLEQAGLHLHGEVRAGEETLYDVTATTGNTNALFDQLGNNGSAVFYCYAIEVVVHYF
jgi:hypothetical protein